MANDSPARLQVPKVVVTDIDEQQSDLSLRRARSSESPPTSQSSSGNGYSNTRASASSASLVHPADILTFRYMGNTSRKGKQVWVDTPETYEAAIDRVISEFRHELATVDRRDISLQISARVGAADIGRGAHKSVRIGRTDEAWKRVTSTLFRYEIVEVYIDGPDLPATPPAYSALGDSKQSSGEWVLASRPLRAGKSAHRKIASWFGA